MGNSLVVRDSTILAKRSRELRAAQYVRMSTDHQRYSVENQAAVIATYARLRGLTIVETYRDAGFTMSSSQESWDQDCLWREQFDNDGTVMSSILKNLKRVMAAEFSRELSVKPATSSAYGAKIELGAPINFP